MSKPLAYLITLVVCFLLQAAIAPNIAIAGCSPNFLVIPVLFVALRSGYSVGAFAGFFCGLFGDLAGDGTIGCLALTFTVLGVVVGVVGQGLESGSPLFTVVIVLCSCLFTELVYSASVVLSNPESNGVLATVAGHALPSALYGTVFACLALLTMNLAVPAEVPGMGRVGGGVGGRPANMPRMKSRLK